MSELRFDTMAVDNGLAKKYLDKNEDNCVAAIVTYLYSSSSSSNICDQMFDGKNLISRTIKDPPSLHYNKSILPNTQKRLKDLASLLKQNAKLIAQLEYVIRKIPIEDTNTQINLIIQHLKLSAKTDLMQLPIDYAKPVLPIKFDGPLLLFGNIIDIISCVEGDLLIRANKETAIISHLFVKLCNEAGWNSIFLQFFMNDDFNELRGAEWDIKQVGTNYHMEIAHAVIERLASQQWWYRGFQQRYHHCCLSCLADRAVAQDAPDDLSSDWHYGTVAIVSEDADVDSAVDKFISSSHQAPWYLRRILVQESVYQQFKDALSWKCNLNKQEQKCEKSNILCSEILTYNGRTFLIDPVEVSTDKSVVTVEAYRTTKEMISLVQKDKPLFLSLWANGIAEINEITHSTYSPVVWVNNMADFRGPPQVAEAIYTNAKQSGQFNIKKCENISKLCKLSQSWLKLDLESRRDILEDVLDKYTEISDPDNFKILRSSISNCIMKSFVDVGNDYVCVGMSQAVGIKTIDIAKENIFTEKNLKSILYGNAFAVGHSLDKIEPPKYDILEQAGVPVVYVGKFVEGDFLINICNVDTLTRAIWTNSGTIFAN